MFEDLLRIATIIIVLISIFLIIKKLSELETRIINLENIEKKKDELYAEEYSTDHLFELITNKNLYNKMNIPSEIVEESNKLTSIVIESVKKPEEEVINLEEKECKSPLYTETILISEDDDNQELINKYSKMKLQELQKIATDLNIEIKLNGKNITKKNLIKEIISNLNNNG